MNPNSGVAPHRRGTFAGVVEKISYLKELGVTAFERHSVEAAFGAVVDRLAV